MRLHGGRGALARSERAPSVGFAATSPRNGRTWMGAASQPIERTTPPSTRKSAPDVAEAKVEQT